MPTAPANPKSFRLQEGDGFGFSDAGEREAITWPEDFDDPPAGIRADAQTIIGEFLRMMTCHATALQVGQRMIVLAYLAGKSEAKTQRELADVLNVSPGRVTQILQAIPSDFQCLCRLRGRTAKRQTIGEETI